MKAKYIEELVGSYYLFPEGEEYSDIATTRTYDDIACHVFTGDARDLCEDRDKLVEALIYAINAHGENASQVYEEIRIKLYPLSRFD